MATEKAAKLVPEEQALDEAVVLNDQAVELEQQLQRVRERQAQAKERARLAEAGADDEGAQPGG